MGALGRQPTSGIRSVFTFTATGGETSVSGPDDNGKTLTYADAKYTDVFINGSLLAPEDYTATSRTSIDDIEPLVEDDIVMVMAFDVFAVANHPTHEEMLSLRVGEVVTRLGSPSSDEVVLDGSTYSKDNLPELWDYAQNSGNLGSANSNFEDIDADTFRVPDLVTDERFLRAVGAADVGREQMDQFQGHHHGTNANEMTSGSAFPYGDSVDSIAAYVQDPISDGTNGTPRTGDETRPINTGFLPCMKAGRII